MPPKKITVVDASGGERQSKLSNEHGYGNVLRSFGVESLVDSEDCAIADFESLEDGRKYTLGPQQRQQDDVPDQVLKDFDLEHIQSIKPDGSWVDCGKGLEFMGRNQFVEEVHNFLKGKLLSPPGSPQEPLKPASVTVQLGSIVQDSTAGHALPPPPAGLSQSQSSTGSTATPQQLPPSIATLPPRTDIKEATALVYSSVSGSGKTVSMLELKSKLPKKVNNVPVAVAYLGFNTGLELLDEEKQYIMDKQKYGSGELGAGEVLARRLAAATIISIVNPNVATSLPGSEQIYKGYRIPKVEESKALLLSYVNTNQEGPIYIVAGVDEVQLLNQQIQVGTIGLGRLFLRILRHWQYKWYKEGIRLLPLGTGIAIDWSADPTTGMNVALHGKDTTLISKEDFHGLVDNVVRSLGNEFHNRFSMDTSKETVTDLIAASYWPRVRLLEWWRDNKTTALGKPLIDSNAEVWVPWFCTWLREDVFTVQQSDFVPGKGDREGKIHCLFELGTNSQEFSVIPDGYTSSSLVAALEKDLSVPFLYDGLDIIKTLSPAEFIPKDAHEFEELGFHVVGTAIHVGLHALKDRRISSDDCVSHTQKKRLGLALWFQEYQAMTHQNGKLLVPRILGHLNSTDSVTDFYPFETNEQTSFKDEVVKVLKEVADTHNPVYIRCGRRTCCDYLYFYLTEEGFICNIDDAKHTNKEDGQVSGESITTADQIGLFNAAVNVHAAVDKAGLRLRYVRLLFVSNRKSLGKPKTNSALCETLNTAKGAAQTLFPNVELELLNKDNFDFGPFSDILAARRKKGSKRKHDDVGK